MPKLVGRQVFPGAVLHSYPLRCYTACLCRVTTRSIVYISLNVYVAVNFFLQLNFINRAAMGRARFLLYTGFIFRRFFFVGD